MNLLIEYFTPESTERYNEYLTCLRHNLGNKFISKIHIFIDDNSKLPDNLNSDKIIINNIERRNTYTDFFNYVNTNLTGEICILSNGDIMFDDTLSYINDENVSGKFISLSRWDILPDGNVRHYDIPYSQDAWIFKSPININKADFTLGKLGCDNRITYLAMKSGLIVTNPSKKIITKHLHLSNFRSDSSDQSKMIRGTYIFVDSNDNLDLPSENYVVSPDNVGNVVNRINQKKGLVRR